MEENTLNQALSDITDTSLLHLGRVADRLLAGKPLSASGQWSRKNRAGRGMEFLDYREYVIGDDLRNIDWRATARSRTPQIRRRRDEAASEWVICLDGSASMSLPDRGKWNLAIQLAAALAYLILRQGNRVSLLVFSDRIDIACPAGRGQLQYGKILRLLKNAQPRTSGGSSALSSCASRIRQQACVAVISDFLAKDAMQGSLDELLHLGGNLHAFQVLSTGECDFGKSESYLLEDVETGEQATVNSSDAARQASQRLDQLQQELATYCSKRGAPFTACKTDQQWNRVLATYLKKLSLS